MNAKIKYISIITFSTVLCMVLHFILPPALISETPENILSQLALLLGFPLTALLWAGIAYSFVAYVFYLIEDRIPLEKGGKGSRYGGSIGALWLLGYVMCVPKFGNPFVNEFVGGLCDAIPVAILGWLLGVFTSKKTPTSISSTFNIKQALTGIVIFVLFFFIARTTAYYMNIIDIGFQVNAVYVTGWTIVMGFCLGTVYLLLGKTTAEMSLVVSAFKFGFVLFGLTWGVFIMFFPLMLKGELINTILMFLIDTTSVTAAYYFSEMLLNTSPSVNHKC